MKRILEFLENALKWLILAAVLAWVADWAIFRVEMARGRAFDTVQVEQYLGTPLKGNKTEYDYEGTAAMNCARALFPRAGAPACWWLRRHTSRWD